MKRPDIGWVGLNAHNAGVTLVATKLSSRQNTRPKGLW